MSYYFAPTRDARHTLARPAALMPNQKALRKKQAHESRASSRNTGIAEVYKRVPCELGRHELDLIAKSYFQQLGHDSQHRIFKFFAWEVAKTRAANGGYTDYPKLANAKLDNMTTAEIGKFLVICALASELYFPTYYGATSTKDTALTREAAHYKVNCERVLRDVRERLTTKPAKTKAKSKLQSSAKSNGKGKGK